MSLANFFGKHEGFAITLLTLFFLGFSLLVLNNLFGVWSPNYGSVVVSYSSVNDSFLKVSEVFDINGNHNDFNVFYRSFASSEPLCFSDGFCTIRVLDVSCSLGVPYVAFQDFLPLDPSTRDLAPVPKLFLHKIRANEVGCFLEEGFDNKKVRLSVSYLVPLEHVKRNRYVHFFFSFDHFSIHHLKVIGLSSSRSYFFVPRNAPLKFSVVDGSGGPSSLFNVFVLLFFVLFPFFPLLVWYFFGREKRFTVPEYLHTIPDPSLEPWKVDFMVNGSFSLSANGIASLLLELYVNNIVKFVKEGKGLFSKYYFLVNEKADLSKVSKLARDFVEFILMNHSLGKVDGWLKCELPRDPSVLKNFFASPEAIAFKKKIVDDKGFFVFITLFIFSLFFIIFIIGLPLLDIGMVLFSAFLLFFSSNFSSIFSRFKGDYYKSYLEWLAFKKMLSDFALIKRYFKEDYSQWKDWLLYATALGEAKNVIKSFKELRFLDPALVNDISSAYSVSHVLSHDIYLSYHSSGRVGGGIGGGGGFGGGGGGGR